MFLHQVHVITFTFQWTSKYTPHQSAKNAVHGKCLWWTVRDGIQHTTVISVMLQHYSPHSRKKSLSAFLSQSSITKFICTELYKKWPKTKRPHIVFKFTNKLEALTKTFFSQIIQTVRNNVWEDAQKHMIFVTFCVQVAAVNK